MRIRPTVARVAAAGALTGAVGVGLLAAPVGAAPGQTAKGVTVTAYVGTDPTPGPTSFSLQPPAFTGITVPVPGNCPFDANAFITITGNAVGHGTINKNGDWGGNTIEGTAVLTDPGNDAFTGPFNGHATGWGGGGQNSNPGGPPLNQGETGQTFTFNGTDGSGNALTVTFDWHFTQNNLGQLQPPTIIFTCS
jgi:hypothetical protein